MTTPGPDWVEQARRFVISSGLAEVLSPGRPAADGAAGPSADSAAECRSCPLCAGIAAFRGRRPDLVVTAAGRRRSLPLDPLLRRCTVAGGQLRRPGTAAATLDVRFTPDPAQWPVGLLEAEESSA